MLFARRHHRGHYLERLLAGDASAWTMLVIFGIIMVAFFIIGHRLKYRRRSGSGASRY